MAGEAYTTQQDLGTVAGIIVRLVRLYQANLSSRSKLECPFEPSCSEYMVIAVQKYGACRGGMKGLARIFRCNPFYKGSHIDWP